MPGAGISAAQNRAIINAKKTVPNPEPPPQVNSLANYLDEKVIEENKNKLSGNEDPNFIPQAIGPVDLYQQFQLTGMDIRGQVSCGQTERSTTTTVGLTINIAALAGWPALVTAKVGTTGSYSNIDSRMLMVHRFFPVSSPESAVPKNLQQKHPIGLSSLTGGKKTIGASLTLTGGVGHSISAEGFSFNVGVSADASTGYKFTWGEYRVNSNYYLSSLDKKLIADFSKVSQDEKSGWVQQVFNWMDSEFPQWRSNQDKSTLIGKLSVELEAAQSMQKAFSRIPSLLKALQYARQYRAAEGAAARSKSVDPDDIERSKEWLKTIKQLQSRLAQIPSELVLRSLIDEVLYWLEKYPALDSTNNYTSIINTDQHLGTKKATAIKAAEALNTAIIDAPNQRFAKEYQLTANHTIRTDLKALNTEASTDIQATPLAASPKSFLTLAAHEPSASASLGASAIAYVGPNANAPATGQGGNISDAPAPTGAGLTASATVSANAKWKFTTYRLQMAALAASGGQVICTQDTNIRYFQREVAGQAGLSYALGSSNNNVNNAIEKASTKSTSPSFKYNSLSYFSSVIYWLYPTAGNEEEVKIQQGSGFRCGTSVNLFKLSLLASQICEEPRMAAKDIWSKITPDDQKWLNGIGKSLLISGKKLVDGLKDGEIASMLECKLDVDSVLLETTWSMSESTILATHKKDDGNILEPSSKKVKELRAAFEKNRTQLLDTDTSLQSLRLRYRIADIKENTITDFKLGLAGLGTAANFSLKTIEQVGIDGIVDLAVVWLNKDLKDAAKMGITGLDKDDDLEGNSRVVSHDKAFPKNQIGKNYSYGKYKEFDIDDQGQFINKDVYIQKFEAEYEEWGNDNKYASEQAVPPTTLICQ